jgi:hypothetical protein
MPSDSDIIISTKDRPESFLTVIGNALSDIPYRFFVLMFLTFLLLSSDTFINRILSNIDNAVDMKSPTSYGTVIQGLLLVFMCMIYDCLIKQQVI